jgi:hypothetical protein
MVVALLAYPIKIVAWYSNGKLQAIESDLAMKEAPIKAMFFFHPINSTVLLPVLGSTVVTVFSGNFCINQFLILGLPKS